MVVMAAQRMMASEVAEWRSQSRARRLCAVSQAKVRSTAHRLGMTANPFWPAGLRTISIVVRRVRA